MSIGFNVKVGGEITGTSDDGVDDAGDEDAGGVDLFFLVGGFLDWRWFGAGGAVCPVEKLEMGGEESKEKVTEGEVDVMDCDVLGSVGVEDEAAATSIDDGGAGGGLGGSSSSVSSSESSNAVMSAAECFSCGVEV